MIAVIQFPGSNDDRDMRFAMKSVLGVEARLAWHKDAELPPGTTAVMCPGGFSYGDALGAGRLLATDLRWLFQSEMAAFVDAGFQGFTIEEMAPFDEETLDRLVGEVKPLVERG